MADVQHSNLTGSAAIHPAAYVSSSDPGAVGANKLWIDTTTSSYRIKIRNAANSAWTTVQNPITTAGDILYGGTGGNLARLAVGTEGDILIVSSGNPAWVTFPAVASRITLATTLY